jgi:hypothetical protein
VQIEGVVARQVVEEQRQSRPSPWTSLQTVWNPQHMLLNSVEFT